MFEVALLLIVALLLPPGPDRLLWTAVMFFVAMPGMYAMLRGAPYVPSSNATVSRMIGLAKIKKGERVYDLGCGDGRIVFAAAAKGANATGYELSVPTWFIAWLRSWRHPRSAIRCRNFWRADLKDADVIFCYLLIGPMQEFKKKIWPTLKPGTRVVTHAFRMKGIEPDEVDQDAVLYVKK